MVASVWLGTTISWAFLFLLRYIDQSTRKNSLKINIFVLQGLKNQNFEILKLMCVFCKETEIVELEVIGND